ncbi:MAG: permease [Amphiplicatus sp.]
MAMRNALLTIMAAIAASLAPSARAGAAGEKAASGHYENFRVAIYVVVGSLKRMADPEIREREFERAMRQVKFDKVYLEVYRDRVFATDEEIEAVKSFFESKGVAVAGGLTLAAGGEGGQFGTFDYEDPADRAECRRAVERAARHFDEIILDDFFFFTSKSQADIAAKGKRSWTQYRLERMREASRNLVLKPARAINPDVKVVIKYPNWYEHFQGLGYDLEKQAQMFDGIYTGTETRDPEITDQLLQQYESYAIFRYFENIRPSANGGGWVDTFSTRYIDRYAEQLWDTLFAKAPEITLFNWVPISEPRPVSPGAREAWADRSTSFDWEEMVASYVPGPSDDPGPGWGRAAGYALERIDAVLGALGEPVGVASYKPYHSTGEDFLHNYLGNVGFPIEMTSTFPEGADLVLLTESAKFDPDIVDKIKAQLMAGGRVVITSGLLSALSGEGIEDVAEIAPTGRVVAIREFLNGYGAGSGESLNDPAFDNPPVLFPEIRFYTNDSWPIVRGVASANGFPILLMSRYANGIFYVLAVPENMGDLYNLPQGALTQIKRYLLGDFPVLLDAPARVSLFVYDNDTFIVQSFRDEPAAIIVSTAGAAAGLRDLASGETLSPEPAGAHPQRREAAARTEFRLSVEPHSYRIFKIER